MSLLISTHPLEQLGDVPPLWANAIREMARFCSQGSFGPRYFCLCVIFTEGGIGLYKRPDLLSIMFIAKWRFEPRRSLIHAYYMSYTTWLVSRIMLHKVFWGEVKEMTSNTYETSEIPTLSLQLNPQHVSSPLPSTPPSPTPTPFTRAPACWPLRPDAPSSKSLNRHIALITSTLEMTGAGSGVARHKRLGDFKARVA